VTEMLTRSAEVLCDDDGEPQRIQVNGATWIALPDVTPTLWHVRRPWWAENTRIPAGAAVGAVDHELWRIQVRSSDETSETPVTLDLAHSRRADLWRLVKVHEADAVTYAELDPSIADF
jgi:hypothetical protein